LPLLSMHDLFAFAVVLARIAGLEQFLTRAACSVACLSIAHTDELRINGATDQDAVWPRDSQRNPLLDEDAQWRHPVNTMNRCVRGGDAALCHIILITFLS